MRREHLETWIDRIVLMVVLGLVALAVAAALGWCGACWHESIFNLL